MNRAHNAAQAAEAIRLAQAEGFDNISIDLIYGGPTLPDDHWQHNVAEAIRLQIPHLSCYALTVEPRTALDYDDPRTQTHRRKSRRPGPAAAAPHGLDEQGRLRSLRDLQFRPARVTAAAITPLTGKGNPIWVWGLPPIPMTGVRGNGISPITHDISPRWRTEHSRWRKEKC